MSANLHQILLTGATGGLGRALALEYAKPGRQLFLSGRCANRLAEVCSLCKELGAEVQSAQIDVRDHETMAAWVASCAKARPLDLAIACAGVSASSRQLSGRNAPETMADTQRLLEVNALGTIRFAGLVAETMLSHGQGQIAFISSIAAYHGLPSSPAYSASKAAVRVYGQSLRHLLGPAGIKINVICPGYIDTPMSRRLRGSQPLRWTAEQAAGHIAQALARDTPEYAFPWPLSFGLKILNFLPNRMARTILEHFAFEVEPDQESPLSPNRL